jgi:hypothetical protein
VGAEFDEAGGNNMDCLAGVVYEYSDAAVLIQRQL